MENRIINLLTSDQKLEINQYVGNLLKKWMALFGIANLSILIGAFIYIFFYLPSEATKLAIEVADEKLSEKVQEKAKDFEEEVDGVQKRMNQIYENVDKRAHEAHEQYGKFTGFTDALEKQLQGSQKELAKIEENIAIISGAEKKIDEAANLLKEVEKHERGSTFFLNYRDLKTKVQDQEKKIVMLNNRVDDIITKNTTIDGNLKKANQQIEELKKTYNIRFKIDTSNRATGFIGIVFSNDSVRNKKFSEIQGSII